MAQPSRQYHLHPPLLIYSGITLLIAIGAFNSQNNLLFWLFGLALSLVLVSGLLSGIMMMSVKVERRAPTDVHAGERLNMTYVVRNASRLMPAFALTIIEVPDVHAHDAAAVDSTEADGSGGGTTRGARGVLRGVLSKRGAADRPPEAFVPDVPRRGSVEVTGSALALQRGVVRTLGYRVETAFPFGIIRKSLFFRQPATVVIRPPVNQPPAPLPIGQRGDTLAGSRPSARARDGEEVHSLREYTPGDSPRLIAWKRSSRTGQLLIKQSASGSPRRTWVVLELLPTDPSAAVERAIAVAASTIVHAAREGRAVGLCVPLADLCTPSRAGAWHISATLTDLAMLDHTRLRPPPARGQSEGQGVQPPAGPADTVVRITADRSDPLAEQLLPSVAARMATAGRRFMRNVGLRG